MYSVFQRFLNPFTAAIAFSISLAAKIPLTILSVPNRVLRLEGWAIKAK